MNTAIVPGSLSAIAKAKGQSLAETFTNADAVIIIDTSGSMSVNDSRNGKSRYDVAIEELSRLQADLPGKLAIVGFSSEVAFFPSGYPTFFGGGTDMAKALQFTKVADVPGIRFILISDGLPADVEKTLSVARTYKNKIDTIFVGPENDFEGGRKFLQMLANASGGQTMTADCVKELASVTTKLLLSAR